MPNKESVHLVTMSVPPVTVQLTVIVTLVTPKPIYMKTNVSNHVQVVTMPKMNHSMNVSLVMPLV